MAAESRVELFSNDSPFSLQYAAPFAIQGETFHCVLQYLMYRKADLFKDKEQTFNIMATTDLKQIERCGKNVRMVDANTWNTERIKAAELALEEKFTQNPDLKEQLLATFPRKLVYATTKDRFWSIGLSEQNSKALVMKEWKGDNVLGKTLTKVRAKLMENRLEEGGDRQDQRVEGQASRDSMRQDGIGNSHVVERHTGRDSFRHGGGRNSLEVGEQASRDSMRKDGTGNSHVVERHTGHDSMRQGGGRNSLGVGERASWDSMRQDATGNSHVVERHTGRDSMRHGGGMKRVGEQASWDSMRQDGTGNSHVVERQTGRDSMRHDGGRNNLGVGERASWESMRQDGGGYSHGVEQQAGRAYKEQGWDAKYQGEEHTSQGRYGRGGKRKSHRVEGQATQDSNRQGGNRGSGGDRETHHDGRDDQTWRDRSGVVGTNRGNPVTEGGEYKESERRSDWQKVAEEMPEWEETEPTSRPKRNMTHQHADHNWNKHGTRNMGLRHTKATHTDMPNQDKFVLFFGSQSPFSQHHPATFNIDGTTFNCAEQYMMYQKTVIFENKEMERKIMETSNPVQQKRYGRQIPEFKFEVWKKHFIEVVDRATEAKFSQNPHLLDHLVATHPKLLVEASPSDRLWGIGRGQKDPLAWDKETWRGKNQLGYIMTRVRDRLMKVKDTHWEEWEKWKDDKRWEEEEAREKREKRKWEPEPSDPYRGSHEERTPKTRRDVSGARDDRMILMKDGSTTSQTRRESYKHVSGKENFEFFCGIKSPFSQCYPASFTIDGQAFNSAEQFTLYQLAVMTGDQTCQDKVMSTSDPKKLESYSRKIRNSRRDVWERKRVQFVERAIIEKFSQNSDLKQQLFATSPKLLAECNHKDVFWSIGYGLGYANTNPDAWDTNNWRGQNELGYALTTVRDRLIEMEKGHKELDVEHMRLQGTTEGEGEQEGKTILMEDEGKTMKEAAVCGEDGEIQKDVKTVKDENTVVNVEIQRTYRDVEEDESKPHAEQDVREIWDSEEEEVTVGGSELRENSTLAGDRDVMERDQRARNSVGEGGNNGSVPLEGEDDGREEERLAGLDSTEMGERNMAEQQKVEKTIAEELKKGEEVMPLVGHESSTKEKNEEVGERTEKKEAEGMEVENGAEDITLLESNMNEDENKDAVNGGMSKEEHLDVGGKTAMEVAETGEDNMVEVEILEEVSDRGEVDGRITVDQHEGVGERAKVTQVLQEESFGKEEQGEREDSERMGTGHEVKTEEKVPSPEGTERDCEGGGKVRERVAKEGNDTGNEVKTSEHATSVPEDVEGGCEGGRRVKERVDKEGNETGKEVKTREEVSLVEVNSVVDVETLAGAEKVGEDTKEDPEKVKSEVDGMVEEDVDVGQDVKKLNTAGKEVKNGAEDITLLESNMNEDENKDAVNGGMSKEEHLDVGGKTAMKVAETGEDNMVEVEILEEVSDRGEVDGRITVDQHEGVGERAKVTQVLQEESFGKEEQGEREDSERMGTGHEVKTEEKVPSPEGTERDCEGGGKVRERVAKEGNDTGNEVKTSEHATSVPEDVEGGCEGGRRVKERVDKEGNETGKEVKTREEASLVEVNSVVDVETLAGAEKVGEDTKEDPEKVKSEVDGMVEEDVDVGQDVKKLNNAGKEVKNGAEDITLLESNMNEDENKDAVNGGMSKEEHLDVGGKTAMEVAETGEDNMVEVEILEEVSDRGEVDGRITEDQHEGVGERAKVTQVLQEESFGKEEQGEREDSERMGTGHEVKTEEKVPSPEGTERDCEGGGKVRERVAKEGNDTGNEVKTSEHATSVPEDVEGGCDGGRRVKERVDKEGNETGKEVKTREEVSLVEVNSVVDVETLAGAEKVGEDTKEDPEKVKSEVDGMVEEDVDVGQDVKTLNNAGKEVKNGENVTSVPEYNVIERHGEGETKDPARETAAHASLSEVNTEKPMPEAKTLFEEECVGDGQNRDQACAVEGDTGDEEDVKTEEEVHVTEDKNVMERDERGEMDPEEVEKAEDVEPTEVDEDGDAKNVGNIRGEDEVQVTVQQEKMGDSVESADFDEDITSVTEGEQVVMEEKGGGYGMEQEETEKTGDVNTGQATVVGNNRNSQTDEVEEEMDIKDPRGPNREFKEGEEKRVVISEADATVVTEEVKAKVQKI